MKRRRLGCYQNTPVALRHAITPAIHLVFQGGDRSGVFPYNVRHRSQEIKTNETKPVTVNQLEGWFSSARLAKYHQAADLVALYAWNAELGAAVFELIGHVEVLLRNAIHQQLAARSTMPNWYDDPYYRFNPQTLADIAKAKARAAGGGRGLTSDRIVSELTFEFWRYLLSSSYQATVWPRASHAFQGLRRSQRSRPMIESQVTLIADTRNRIAHQEPVFTLPVAHLEADILKLAKMINPQAADWIGSQSRVSGVIAARPL